ncbi:DUF2510 domain-containing protein [Microbacterium esteraromaticum]|uniref:DUF2510 domain-containing protein n=1 Tax=Microbacterium esteraromaticum TaxID=57043 RepID=UPI001CD5C821|nr:DUF2510 domain-containing protein [Microbacterium esteraromaticum]MCA1307539.1 DUF2510 domain-containing protein [Microbacterium esteraromaticum]
MSTPAGWYDDGSGRQRWWDGQQWTEHFAPEGQQPEAEQPEPQPSSEADANAFDPDATVLREEIPAASQDDQPTQVYPPSDVTAGAYAPPAAPGYADVNATAAYPGAYQAPAAGQAYGAYAPAEPAGPKKTPVLGFVGFGLAIVGTILACIPVTFIFGAFVLFAAFVVSLIAVFLKNTKKWPSITGLALSIVGGIVGTIIFAATAWFIFSDSITEPDYNSTTPFPEESQTDAPDSDSDASSGEIGVDRPSTDEVAAGFTEIIDTMGMAEELSDEQITCYAEYFVASDIPDETLWVIASGDETLTDVDAATEFTEKLTDGMTTCLIP